LFPTDCRSLFGMPRFALLTLTVAVAMLAPAAYPAERPVKYVSFKSERGFYHAVFANLESDRVSTETICSPRLRSFSELVRPDVPTVALTGTFFAPGCQRPVADVLVNGDLVAKGERGSVLAVDWFGRARIFDSGFNKDVDWSGYRYGLRGAVRVLRDGKVCPDPKSQKFRDRRIWGRAARTAVGITKGGRLALFATSSKVTLSELGRAMRSQGVVDGISLDGGSSTAFFYRG